jgi:hypothetical protein
MQITGQLPSLGHFQMRDNGNNTAQVIELTAAFGTTKDSK